jgi:hypothetical protein
MELKLVPIEGEKVLTEEEKERIKRRARPISPEVIRRFSDAEQKEMRFFLASLIVFTEQFHHDLAQIEEHKDNQDYYEEHIAKLQVDRKALFENPSPPVAKFIELLELYPMEPWHEYELMIAGIRGDDLNHYYETKLKADIDEYHTQVEGNIEKEQEDQMKRELKCRMTPKDIRDLILFHSLEDLVKHLIASRQLISGEFWNVGLYDL